MTELKKCPFCGCDSIFKTTELFTSRMQYTRIYFRLECINCGASVSDARGSLEVRLTSNGDIKVDNDEREQTVEIWNRRAE